MPHMRASQSLFKKIWALSYLLQAIRIRGQASWSCKVQLVANTLPLAIGFLLLAEGETSSNEQVSLDN